MPNAAGTSRSLPSDETVPPTPSANDKMQLYLLIEKGIDEKLGTIEFAMHRVRRFAIKRKGGFAFIVDDIGPVWHERSGKRSGVHAVS